MAEHLNQDFHVFLSYNSKDRPAVRQLGEALRARGLRVWLDEWELKPGQQWQEALEDTIATVKTAAVLVGANGLGPWEYREVRAILEEFVNGQKPVIPVMLPGAPDAPNLPLFLRGFHRVDLRQGLTKEGLDSLQWGITGKKPEAPAQPEERYPLGPKEKPDPAKPGSPKIVPDTEYWKSPELPVLLLVSCADQTIAQRVQQRRYHFQQPLPVFHATTDHVFATNQQFRFDWQAVGTDQILPRVKQFLEQHDPRFLVIVSDGLVACAGNSRYEPTPVAKEIRSLFLRASHFCGMVGVVQGLAQRTSDVDRVFDARAINDSAFINAVTGVADGLRLKAPPGPTRELARENAIVVQVAQDEADMEACLRLRHSIYDRMGYLDDEISNCPAQLELDCYDCYHRGRGAIHWVAKVHGESQVVGTVRLVLAREINADIQESVIGSPPRKTMEAQAELMRKILDKRDPSGFLKQRVKASYFATLPILQSTEFSKKSGEILRAAGDAAELSRLVVVPLYRGLGVSKLLVRAVIATALDLKKELLLLECVPAHVGMYEKFGFEPIPGTHSRAQDLDQTAIAMMLRPRRGMDRVTALAENDLQMIRSSSRADDASALFDRKHLCLCAEVGCWSNGGYASKSKQSCPLRDLHDRETYVRPLKQLSKSVQAGT